MLLYVYCKAWLLTLVHPKCSGPIYWSSSSDSALDHTISVFFTCILCFCILSAVFHILLGKVTDLLLCVFCCFSAKQYGGTSKLSLYFCVFLDNFVHKAIFISLFWFSCSNSFSEEHFLDVFISVRCVLLTLWPAMSCFRSASFSRCAQLARTCSVVIFLL